MNTIDELVSREIARAQHDSWNEGEYVRFTIVPASGGLPARPAPNATKYEKEREPEVVPVYTLAGNGEPEWRAYVGPRDKRDTAP